jgi:hypothetical protein
MADDLPTSDPGRPEAYPGTPGWVKAIGLAVLIVLLLAAFIVITGLGGPHGPQRHADQSVDAAPRAVAHDVA